MVGVHFFRDGLLDLWKKTDTMNIAWVRVASNFLFGLKRRRRRRPNEHTGSVAELVGSFRRPRKQWTRRFDAQHGMEDPPTLCTFHSSIQYTKSKHLLKCLTFFLFPLAARIAECSFPESQNTLGNYCPCQHRRIAECLEIKDTFHYAKDSGNFGRNSNGEVRFGFFWTEYSGSPLEVVHTFRSTEIRRSIFDKPVVCPNYRSR